MPKAQGVSSDISDLTLRSGKGVHAVIVEIGAAVTPTPTLTRDMEASSSLSVPVYDPTLNLLELSLLSEKFDATVDGLRFRYLGASKSGKAFTISFEDQVIARLRELGGPKRAFRAKQTRANFICGLVEDLAPEVPIWCPQRHEKQPIEAAEKEAKPSQNARQSKASAEESKTNLGKGIGDTKGLNIEGVPLSASQKELANTALEIANKVGAPFTVQVALIASLITESTLGSASPQNVLQAEQEITGSGGEGAAVGTAEEEISGYLTGKPAWTGISAIEYYKAHPQATFYEIAQNVQVSGAGESTEGAANYGKFGDEARQIVEAFGGATGSELASGSTSEEVTEPYTFQVGKKETYWAAIQRLAKEVNWRAFVVAGRFFYISETELSRGQVRLAIERDPGEATPKTKGVLDVDFDFNANQPVTEVTVTALAQHWEPPPGSVVTLAGYGPASLGAGDAPPEKGTKEGIASAVKASTHEGKGRYLVTKIESPLAGDAETRQITITLTKPTQALPEKRATTKTVTTGVSPVGGTAANASGVGGYVSPVSGSEWSRSRTDMGVDFINNSASSKVFAIGNAKIIKLGAPGWPGEGGVLYQLLDGARQGQYIFCYENVLPHVQAGAQVSAGQTIATMMGTGYPWIEIGFSDANGSPLASPEYTEGMETKAGKEMAAFLDSLGAP